jgi:riboflavin biosynthesis pyrimidine reductase
MSPQPTQHGRPAARSQPLLERLLPAAEPTTAAALIEQMGLWQRPVEPGASRGLEGAATQAPSRPRVLLNMVSSADGRATLDGRSGPLSDAADRALFHALRASADAVLVGAGTIRAERYGRIIPDASQRALRVQRGLSEEPLACIVSGDADLDSDDIPLLAEPAARVAILTPSAASLPAPGAHVDYIRTAREGALDLPAALRELGERFPVSLLLCEGGPHLACQLVADGLVDELFLTLSPRLAGGQQAGSDALRILAGEELDPPRSLELLALLRHQSQVFLRYGVLEA